MMKLKTICLTLALVLTSTIGFSQKKVKATSILNAIKNGKDITYKNTTIEGVLDFTFMNDALKKLPKRRTGWWGTSNSDNLVKKEITSKISFVNCTFTDDVLAYIPDEDSGYTFTADFEKEVVFSNCTFERKALFKYSKFAKNADFRSAKFKDDSTFKYAKFNQSSAFNHTVFQESATFKYSTFRENVSFENAVFEETATFKYTKFKDGVSFKNVKFKEDLNIKYTEVSGEFNITGMDVGYDIDAKYTKINGKSFNKHLLNSRN